jgi:sarcosine oxidase
MSSETTFDAIVIGLGGMGSATLYELASRGLRVLGVEQFGEAHPHGSSHGQTRILRRAYYEGPGYVPLVRRAYQRWHDLEQLSGKHLLTECDCLSVGPGSSELIQGVRRSAIDHGLPVESLIASEVTKSFPAFRLDDSLVGVVERGAGFLYVEECVRTYLSLARQRATVQFDETVLDWKTVGSSVEVTTDRGKYSAGKLILTAGPWAADLLREAGIVLRLMRQVMLWFGTSKPQAFRRDRFPVFIADVDEGTFYGVPMIDPVGVKVARHYGAPELSAVKEVDRSAHPEDETAPRSFLRRYLPDADGPLRQAKTCIYTLSPDRHFIIDRHPESPHVVYATGFSGHGFKFASAVGEVLADLAEGKEPRESIAMFRSGRFAGTSASEGG